MKRFAKSVSRARRLGEIAAPGLSIRNFCRVCMGGHEKEVELCTDPACWLYPWRFRMRPETAKKQGRVIDFLPETATRLPNSDAESHGRDNWVSDEYPKGDA